MMEQTVEMTLDKETKGSVRYAEKGDPATQILRTLYIRKSAFTDGGYPEEIQVTIESQTSK